MTDDRASHDRPDDDPVLGARVADAVTSYGESVRPSPGGWDRIESRLPADDGRRRPARSVGSGRPVLVAATVLVVLALVGVVVARSRTGGGDDLKVAGPDTAGSGELVLVALDVDGRLVELGRDGALRRVIYDPPDDEPLLFGPISASSATHQVFVSRSRSTPVCPNRPFDNEIVAVSLVDGSVTVVGSGAAPEVSPNGRRLIYEAPRDPTCPEDPASTEWVVRVRDLGTGAVVDVPTPSLATPAVPTPTTSTTPADPATRGQGNSSSITLYATGFAPPSVATWDGSDDGIVVRTFGSPGSLQHHAVGDPLSLTPDGGPPVPFPAFAEAEDQYLAYAPMGVDPGTGELHVGLARSARQSLLLEDARLDRDGTLASHTVVSIGAVDGWTPVAFQVSADPQAGAIAAAARSWISVDGQPLPTGHEHDGILVIWDGSQSHTVPGAYDSVAWVRVPTAVPAPVTTTEPPAPDTTPLVGTSVPSTTTPVTFPAGTQVPMVVPDPAAVPGDGSPEEAAVAQAYRDFFERGDRSALEGSGVLEPAIQSGSQTVENGGKGVTVVFTRIEVTGDTTALVDFRLFQGTREITAPTSGGAVFADGRWKVSAATMCTLLSRVSIPCPAG